MGGRRLFVFVVGPLLVSACALIADLGDRTLGSIDASAGPGDGSATDGAVVPDDGSSAPDAPVVVTPPSFCDGILFYASFDAKLTGDRGGESTLSLGGVTRTAEGKFGGALSLVRDAGSPATGAAHYFLASDAGNPWPEDIGSISLWYRAVPGASPNPVLYRPVATLPPAPLQTAGLVFFLDINNRGGLHEGAADPVLTFALAETAPYLRPGDYNHWFAGWRKPDGGAGGDPTAYIAVNGGLGVDYADSGASYPDAADDAGELAVPYRGFTRRPWTSQGPAVGIRFGGSGGNSPDGTIDDVAIWSRVLSFDEVAAVYQAGQALGDVCELR